MKLIKDLGMEYATISSKQKSHYGLYECPLCSAHFRTQLNHVKNGSSTKCKSCASTIKMTKHGGSGTKIHRAWKNMKQRCYNKNNSHYEWYGGKGVAVCELWKNNFKAFQEWSLKNGYSEELSIDRINNNGDYEPSNCRWTTNEVQARNGVLLNSCNTSGYRGITLSSSGKWIAQIGVSHKRIRLGTHDTKLEAAKAYDKYVTDNRLEHTTNFP